MGKRAKKWEMIIVQINRIDVFDYSFLNTCIIDIEINPSVSTLTGDNDGAEYVFNYSFSCMEFFLI